jgi:hypothetical protein
MRLVDVLEELDVSGGAPLARRPVLVVLTAVLVWLTTRL